MATGVDARLLKSTRFPPEFSQKVDMQKVNLQVMKKWIASKISDILGSEDDVVIELVFNLIEGPRYPDIKSLQIQLTGFLDKDTAVFCKDLWKLLLSAQSSPQGVPKELLEAKKLELIQEKIEADRAAETAKQRRDDWDRRDREVADLKDRDRRDRAAARGDTWQGRRGDRDFENRVTFHEEDVVVDAPTKGDENRPLDHARNRHHPGRAREVAATPEALINRINDEDQSPLGNKLTHARGRDHPEEIHIGVGQTNALREVGRLGYLDLCLRSEILPHQSADVILHQGAVL
ncbi:serine arginine repetitive matrix 1 [Fusarium sp. NRRL 52700]|nr:serine arginine repetitive matrix 1 [Fusarium sp. NRRL 52700]